MLAAQRRQEAGESDGESDAGSDGEGPDRSCASARPASAPASRRAPPAARPGFVGVPQQLASGGVFRPGRFVVAQPALREGGGGGGGGGGSVALLEDALRRAKMLRAEAEALSARRDQRPALRKAREAALLEAELTRAPRRLRKGYVRATRTSLSRVLCVQATRTGGAGQLAPRAPRAVRPGYAYPPRAPRTYRAPWAPSSPGWLVITSGSRRGRSTHRCATRTRISPGEI